MRDYIDSEAGYRFRLLEGIIIKIRYKSLLIIGIVTITLMASLYLVTQYLTFAAIDQSEAKFCSSNAERIMRNLNIDLEGLSKVVNDWAIWDDSYSFMLSNNSDFIESNLVENTFENLNVNLIFFFDTSKQMFFGKTFCFFECLSVPEEVAASNLLAHGSLFSNDLEDTVYGVILLGNKPLLVVSHPILTSTHEGPSMGTLIMGRYLDSNELAVLSTGSGLTISMYDYANTSSLPNDFLTAREHLSREAPIFTQNLNETHMAGYLLLEDLSNNPIAIMRADDVRTAYAQGKDSLTYTFLSFIFIGVTITVVLAFLLDKQVLSRISILSASVRKIAKGNPDTSTRIAINGNDELSSLAGSINSMLDVIDNQTGLLESTVNKRTKELAESREKLASILNASPDAIMALDTNLNLLEFNEPLTSLTGLQRENLICNSLLNFISAKDQKRVSDSLLQLGADKDRVSRLDCLFFKSDGSEFPIELSTSILANTQETAVGYVSIIRDLTERKLLEGRLLKSERLAGIGELAGMIGHDLRNPLAGIKNATYFLRKKQGSFVGDNGLQMLAIIEKSVDYSNKIINDLLDYSREIRLDLEYCSPKSLIDYVLLTIKIPANVRVMDRTKCSPTVLADATKLERVFTNIIKNAFDAMAETGGALEINSNQIGEKVELTFADTGSGMSKEVMERIFVPLFTTKAQGMGFGLAICRRIIEAHSGMISVKSELGKGTTFTISLPIKEVQGDVKLGNSHIC